MIDFSLAPKTVKAIKFAKRNYEENRAAARWLDEHEHQEAPAERKAHNREVFQELMKIQAEPGPGDGQFLTSVIMGEARQWSDMMAGGGIAAGGLGNAAIRAVATPEQRARFDKLFCAMAITEPGCGSDTAAVATTAKLDPATKEWIINGEKIFVTSGKMCDAIVVWATLDKSKGRAAIKSFVVEKSRPGCTLTKLEHKLGIRASDTAAIVFEDCRIPYDNILGSPEIREDKAGQGGVLATFDATRPGIAAQALGFATAALDFTKEKFEEAGYAFPYDKGIHSMNAVQREIMQMEAMIDATRMLVWQCAGIMDRGLRNSLEASMAKAKAGRVVSQVCQRCVALLGPWGYSREWMLEKWMRDCKINDLYEGTGQIQMLVVCRSILGFNRDQLK
jgi:acyl-CoA dehydrogenase